jgi:RNA-directed DNA polymerase
METLHEAYRVAKSNNGAPGIDGVTFEAMEESGEESFLRQIRDELAPPRVPPVGTSKCTSKQVYNELTKKYEWKSVCQ